MATTKTANLQIQYDTLLSLDKDLNEQIRQYEKKISELKIQRQVLTIQMEEIKKHIKQDNKLIKTVNTNPNKIPVNDDVDFEIDTESGELIIIDPNNNNSLDSTKTISKNNSKSKVSKFKPNEKLLQICKDDTHVYYHLIAKTALKNKDKEAATYLYSIIKNSGNNSLNKDRHFILNALIVPQHIYFKIRDALNLLNDKTIVKTLKYERFCYNKSQQNSRASKKKNIQICRK